ncbi:MAG: hypothetical protein HXY51_09990 [Nitrospirae bacterium]|nr:hypothetical protein [Nitrospirota bacterium]
MKRFIHCKPYKHVIEPHPDGVHEIHKLKARRRNLPRAFADVSTDAIENMRAALDQAVYAIAVAHGITNHRVLRNVAFPFSKNVTDFHTRLKGACAGFPQEILTVLKSFKPYMGGNNTLWAINELANISKHQTLTTVAFRIVAAYTHEISGMGNIIFPPQWDRPQNEFVLGTAMPNTRVKYSVGFGFNIGFDDIPVIAGKPIIGVLNDMASIVDRLIDEMESEGCRIGLFK